MARRDKAQIALREELDHKKGALWADTERQAFISRSRDICDYMLPQASSLLCADPAAADAKWKNIFDTTATDALEISVAGHMNHATPIGDRFMSLVLRGVDEEEQDQDATVWLRRVAKRMMATAHQANTRAAFTLLTRDCLAFGGGVNIVDEDDVYTWWHHHVAVGEYALAANKRGQINTLYREVRMTLDQMVERFGLEALSSELQREWKDPSKRSQSKTLAHAIEPRKNAQAGKDGKPVPAVAMPWRSVYWEMESKKQDGILSESGYRLFPVLAPRYAVQGSSGLYGYGPGCVALSHVRSLQHRHHRLAECIDWQTLGLIMAPTTAQGNPQFRPGGRVLVDSPNPNPVRNVADNNANLQHLLLDIENVREQIKKALHADTFTMISSMDEAMTATEVSERRQEKFDILGPKTARLIDEMPRPWVDIVFDYMQQKAGALPDAPPSIIEMGATIDPEFESTLAKSARTQRIMNLRGFVADVAFVAKNLDPQAVYKIKTTPIVGDFAEAYDVDPDNIRSDEEAQQIADARAKAQAQADQIAMAEQGAKAVQAAGSVRTDEPNLVTAMARGAA